MKPTVVIPTAILSLLLTGCAHVSMSAPVSVGKNYTIAAPGAYWNVKAGDLAIKATEPISVRILEVRPPYWARVQLTGPTQVSLAGNAPFWINLQSAVTISEIPEKN